MNKGRKQRETRANGNGSSQSASRFGQRNKKAMRCARTLVGSYAVVGTYNKPMTIKAPLGGVILGNGN